MSAMGNEGQRAAAPVGQSLSCPKCHGPLQARGAASSAPIRTARAPAPVLLRLLVLLLLVAALATPLVAGYYLRSGVVDKASASARQFLDYVHAKDADAATGMMTVAATQQMGWPPLRSIVELDRSRYEITSARLKGELIDVRVTCIVPDDAELPALPIEVDKNPRATLTMERDKDNGRWHVTGIALQPKPGTNSVPQFKLTKSIPVGGGVTPGSKIVGAEPQKPDKKNDGARKKD